MKLLSNSFRLHNTDLRWYRDKYLIIVAVVCFLVGMSLVWGWPPPRHDVIRAAGFLGVVALCLFVSPQRSLILAGMLGIIFIRGILGITLYHSVAALIVGLAAGIACCFLGTRKGINLSPDYKVNDYSYSELAIDVVVLGAALLLYSKLS